MKYLPPLLSPGFLLQDSPSSPFFNPRCFFLTHSSDPDLSRNIHLCALITHSSPFPLGHSTLFPAFESSRQVQLVVRHRLFFCFPSRLFLTRRVADFLYHASLVPPLSVVGGASSFLLFSDLILLTVLTVSDFLLLSLKRGGPILTETRAPVKFLPLSLSYDLYFLLLSEIPLINTDFLVFPLTLSSRERFICTCERAFLSFSVAHVFYPSSFFLSVTVPWITPRS